MMIGGSSCKCAGKYDNHRLLAVQQRCVRSLYKGKSKLANLGPSEALTYKVGGSVNPT